MFTKHTHSILAVIAALIGANAVSAGNVQTWHYDKESDTIVYSFVGQPVSPVAVTASQQTAVDRPWHYDEETDTVLYNFADRSAEQATVFAGMTE